MKRLKTLLLIISLISSISVLAQRERNYIYVLDCTKSMTGYNGSPNIWEPTKDYLRQELEKHTPGTTLHVIPFQGKTLPAFSFDANNLDWKKIEKQLEEHVKNVTNTNICDAWDATDKYIDKHKDNYIILLTDGKDNVNGMDVVAKKLSQWCGKYPNSYAFYVQLTEAAIDKSVAKVIDICDNEYVIDASKGIPVFGGIDNDLIIYANTHKLKKIHKIGFSAVGRYKVNSQCNDPYFDVKVIDNKVDGGIFKVQIVAKQPISQIDAAISETYNFTFDVLSEEINIVNPTITVQMSNAPERSLEILSEEVSLGKATWYDRFLFWGESDQDTLSVDLKACFNEEAIKDAADVHFQITDTEGNHDFELFYNNQPIESNKIILRSGDKSPSILSIVFDTSAKEGKRYFVVKPVDKDSLDNINDQPVEQYKLSLRSEYEVNWNPLKIIIMWLCIILVAALLLWFLILKHLIYPTIGVKSIQITDPYFAKINIKGKRRVVFTNKKEYQSLFNRIFTGEILYKTNEVWTSPFALEAGAKRKTLRALRNKDYVINPYSSILKAPNDYVIENITDKKTIKITIN